MILLVGPGEAAYYRAEAVFLNNTRITPTFLAVHPLGVSNLTYGPPKLQIREGEVGVEVRVRETVAVFVWFDPTGSEL